MLPCHGFLAAIPDSFLQEGAVILVTDKEEEAWWRGQVGGKTGVFPSNYVEPAKCKFTFAGVTCG